MMTKTIDGTGLYHDAIKRVQQLEKLNSQLAAEVDRQRGVVEAAQRLVHLDGLFHARELSRVSDALENAVRAYEASREGADG